MAALGAVAACISVGAVAAVGAVVVLEVVRASFRWLTDAMDDAEARLYDYPVDRFEDPSAK